jgi:hypothetical protein
MTNHVDPTKEVFALFKDLPRDEPIHMLNLVKLREQAAYADGRQSGSRPIAYGREAGRCSGGSAAGWDRQADADLIGPRSERWDLAFIAECLRAPR